MEDYRQIFIKARWYIIGVSCIPLFLFVGFSIIYYLDHGWDIVNMLYYTTTTITTIGYGDFHPTSVRSKTLFIILSTILIIGLPTILLSLLSKIKKITQEHIEEWQSYEVQHFLLNNSEELLSKILTMKHKKIFLTQIYYVEDPENIAKKYEISNEQYQIIIKRKIGNVTQKKIISSKQDEMLLQVEIAKMYPQTFIIVQKERFFIEKKQYQIKIDHYIDNNVIVLRVEQRANIRKNLYDLIPSSIKPYILGELIHTTRTKDIQMSTFELLKKESKKVRHRV